MTAMSRQEITALGTNLISPFNKENVTPQGYDFTIGSISQMRGMGKLYRTGKSLPIYDDIPPKPLFYTHDENVEDGFGWQLRPGVYFMRFREVINMPDDMLAYMHPRSTLLRMGATLETAVWDAGYSGISATILHVITPMGIEVEQGARIGHMTFHRLDEISDAPYVGQYQGEGTKTCTNFSSSSLPASLLA